MKLNEIIQGEFLPFDEDISAQVARYLYRAAGGNLDRARKVAVYFHQKVLAHMEQQHTKQQTKRI